MFEWSLYILSRWIFILLMNKLYLKSDQKISNFCVFHVCFCSEFQKRKKKLLGETMEASECHISAGTFSQLPPEKIRTSVKLHVKTKHFLSGLSKLNIHDWNLSFSKKTINSSMIVVLFININSRLNSNNSSL